MSNITNIPSVTRSVSQTTRIEKCAEQQAQIKQNLLSNVSFRFRTSMYYLATADSKALCGAKELSRVAK